MNLYEQVGYDRLKALFVDFYDRVFDDIMIGFLFHGKDKARLVEKETEFTARILGGDIPYTGKAMRAAHAKVPIVGGHFDRRMQIMREVIADHDIPASVSEPWLEHAASLRAVITADPDSSCNHDLAMERIGRSQDQD